MNKKASIYGLYVFGVCLVIAAYYLANAVMAASKLGELPPPFQITSVMFWTFVVVMVILEFVTRFVVAIVGGE